MKIKLLFLLAAVLICTQLTSCTGYNVRAIAEPPDSGTVKIYRNNGRVLVEANPSFGYRFDHWEGEVQSAISPISLTVDQANKNSEITAHFEKVGIIPALHSDGRKDTVKKLSLTFEETYTQIDGDFSIPGLADEAKKLLKVIGVEIVEDDDSPDASLKFIVNANALGDYYTEQPIQQNYRFYYTGVEFTGQAVLAVKGQKQVIAPLSYRIEPLKTISSDRTGSANEAPYSKAWPHILFEGIARLWGPEYLLHYAQDADYGEKAKEILRSNKPVMITFLADTLNNPDHQRRRDAASALSDIGSQAQAAVPALASAVSDADPVVREYAALALANIGPTLESDCAIPALTAALDDERQEICVNAGLALSVIDPALTDSVPELLGGLQSSDATIRQRAAKSLGNLRPVPKESASALIKALKDKDQLVREYAALAIGKLSPIPVEAVEKLINVVKEDWYSNVRDAAEAALNNLGPNATDAVPILEKAFNPGDDNDSKRISAIVIRVLGEIGPNAISTVPTLSKALRNNDATIRKNVMATLIKIGLNKPEVFDVLSEAMNEDYPYTMHEDIVNSLCGISADQESVLPLLIKALRFCSSLKDKKFGSYLTDKVIEGLLKMNSDVVIPALHEALQNPELHDGATIALKRFGVS